MNLGQLKEHVKRQFGDESGVQVTDADVMRWLELAQNDIVRENEGILDERTVVNLVSGQDEYAFPDDLLTIRSVWVKDNSNQDHFTPVPFLSLTQFERSIGPFQGITQHSIPRSYIYTTYQSTIFLHPIPKSDINDGLKIVYAKYPEMPVVDVDTLGLPLQYHSAILQHCLTQAYELDENWEGSNNKLMQFQNNINKIANRRLEGPTDSYPVITINPEDQ